MAKIPDEGTFPDSTGKVLDKAGLKDTGYHDKKGTPNMQAVTPNGITGHIFNQLPPGDNIEDQEVADIMRTEKMTVRRVTDGSYPGDGWRED